MDDEKDENAEEETETVGDAAKLEPLPDDLRETVESFVETTRLACELVPDQSDRERCVEVVEGAEKGDVAVEDMVGEVVRLMSRYRDRDPLLSGIIEEAEDVRRALEKYFQEQKQ